MLVLAVVCIFSVPLEAAVQAELDRSRIVEGETVTLTILTDDPRQNLDADFSVLEEDFQLLDRRSETQLSIVNGRQTAVVRLLLTLEPKSVGDFEIPSLTFGSDVTRAIAIKVDPAPELEPGSQPPVFIEVEVLPGEGPYFVHAQLSLIVRVFYQQNLTEAAIGQPEPSPASVRLMQETPFQAERGGERYRVLERSYAVFPERSGELTIPPMQLTGRLVERRTSNVWQPSVRGRRVQVESETLTLNIEPKPPAFAGSEWQPAREFRMTQQVSSGDTLRVGEPVTRTVIIDAVGLEENMIAEPVWPELSDARIYPDQPQGITRDDGQWALGHKEFRYAVVPEQEGELVLPELRVEWWDTQNNRAQTAVLPSHTIQVLPSTLVPPQAAPGPAASPAVFDASGVNPGAGPDQPLYWRWLTFLFAGLWILTLLAAAVLIRSRKARAGSRVPAGVPMASSEAGILADLEKACSAGDIRMARRSLQSWLRKFGPVSLNGSLLEFADGVEDEALRESLYALDGEGYRPQDPVAGEQKTWDGRACWKQWETWHRSRQAADKKNKASPTDLYAVENRNVQ